MYFHFGLPWYFSWWRIHLQCRRSWLNSWVRKIPPEKGKATQSRIIGLQCRRPGFDPWVGKIPWRRTWQPFSSILSWEVPIDRGDLGLKESDTMEQLSTAQHISFLVKCLLISFMIFLNGFFFFLSYCWIWEFFIFSKFCNISCSFVIVSTDSFTKQNVLILMKFNLSFFLFFYESHLMSSVRTLCLIPVIKVLLLFFS